MDAWSYTSREITGIGTVEKIQALFFDSQCAVSSGTAMNGGDRAWTATAHQGTITIPGGQTIPAGVISFAMGGEGRNFFVMSTPSVWQAAGKSDNGLGSLETLMTAVVLHEATHVAQIPTYGERIGRLATAHRLPESFSDDSIQERFSGNAEFASSISRETDLLLRASQAPGDSEAKRLAQEARSLIQARQDRWYTDSYLAEAEDIWLSMEGSAQWAAYRWLIDPRGGGVPAATALQSFSTGKWWSQVEGFALFMALDRLTAGAWKQHAFADGDKTALQMLTEAIGPTSP